MTRRNWLVFAAMLIAASALALSGCGGDDGGLSAEDMARLDAAEAAAAAAAAEAAEAEMAAEAAQAEAAMAHEEAEAAQEEAEAAKMDAAAAQAEAEQAKMDAAAAQAEAEKEVEIPEPDTSALEETIAALEEQIEGLEEDAAMEAERVSLLGMSAGARIIATLGGMKPAGSAADVAATRNAIVAGLKGTSKVPNHWYNGNAAKIAGIIPNAVIAGAGLFYDFNGDGFENNNADNITGTNDDLITTVDERRLGADLDRDGQLSGTPLAAGGGSSVAVLDENIFGDLNGDGTLAIVAMSAVIESGMAGVAGTITGGVDLNGDGLIQTAAYGAANGPGGNAAVVAIDESALGTLAGFRTNDVGFELRQATGRYQFQYDDDGDNQTGDVRLGPDGTGCAGPPNTCVTPEGIDMRDHLSTFALAPVVGVDGVNLVKFSIDSAYSSDGNVVPTLATGVTNIALPLPPDPTSADDVPTTLDGRYGVESYGAWLSDSFFGVHRFHAVTNLGANTASTSAGAGVGTGAVTEMWTASRTGGSPSTLRGLGESATWTGAMVGHDTLATAEADMLLQGNARIDARITSGTLADPDADGVAVFDVMLDNITNQEGMDARVTDLSWSSLEIIDDASGVGVGFRKARGNDPNVLAEIEGWVFSDASEIVGQFDRSGIIGAFGATLAPTAGMDDMASN